MIQNDLLLRALRGEVVDRPPVWMMRQAGRYLPEFMVLKKKYDFFTRCTTPELASQITVQPIDRFAPDAAILFSDILVVPKAMGIDVKMKNGVGPWVPNPVRSQQDVDQVYVPEIEDALGFVLEAIHHSKELLQERVPLIGFAGSPWTILCYAVQGQGSKTFDKAKAFCFAQPKQAHRLLQKITDATKAYLLAKVAAGVDVIQLFDSWGGVLSPTDYQLFSWPYLQQLIDALQSKTAVILFAKGCWYALETMANSGASAVGIDWTCDPKLARQLTGGKVTLQGNLDPSRLFSSPKQIQECVHQMIREFGKDRYIANLGHGILPDVPVSNAEAFIEAVKTYKAH